MQPQQINRDGWVNRNTDLVTGRDYWFDLFLQYLLRLAALLVKKASGLSRAVNRHRSSISAAPGGGDERNGIEVWNGLPFWYLCIFRLRLNNGVWEHIDIL